MPEHPAPRGRPRDAARDEALLRAALAELEENGYGGLTTAAVARRAGVSTATLYRRWRSKEDLVVAAAVSRIRPLSSEDDTGTLAGDLTALLRDKAESLEGPGGRLLRLHTGEAAHNDALAEVLTAGFIRPVQERAAVIVRRAAARGDIPSAQDPSVIADLVIGPMISRAFLTRAAPHAEPLTTLATQLVPYLLRALGARCAAPLLDRPPSGSEGTSKRSSAVPTRHPHRH